MKNNTAQKNIPHEWQEIILGAYLIKEKGSLPKVLRDERIDDAYMPYLTINTIDGGNPKYAPKNSGIMAGKDDLLVVADGSGSGRLYRGYEGLVSSTFLKITTADKNKITNDFLSVVFSYLDFMRPEFRKGGAIPHFDYKRLDNVKILLPLPREQQKIAEILGVVDEDIAKTQEVIRATEKLKKGLMQELFTRGIGHTKFKKTKLGEIPENWEVGELSNYLKRQPEYGLNAPAVSYSEKLPTYIRITDISESGNFINAGKKSVDHPDAKNYYLSEGDLLFARTGASVGKTYLYNPKDGRLVFAGFLIRIKSDEKKLMPNYLSLLVQTNLYWNWVRVMSARSGQPGINGNEYASMQLIVPPIIEQKKIAEILSALDQKINVNKKLKITLTKLKKGLMHDLLGGKVRV